MPQPPPMQPAVSVDSKTGAHPAPGAAHSHSQAPAHGHAAGLFWPVVGALGVVFGDIGTSPLYALKECVDEHHGVAPTPANILGVLSLVTWALTMVVMVKYLTFVMKADNGGV